MTTTKNIPADLWTVAGTTDEVTECDFCGRTELKGTVRMLAGEVELFAGSDCAGRLAGRPAAKIRTEAAAADRAAREAARLARLEAQELERQERAAARAGQTREEALEALRAAGFLMPSILRQLERGDSIMWRSYFDGVLG